MELINELTNTARARARALPHRTFECSKQRPNFADAIRGKETLDVIAEYKRASPSSGSISERNLAKQITAYEDGGAAAISVLTEPSYFKGSFDDLEDVVRATKLPVLMKDFVVDQAQIAEASFLGASAVLLIVRCLSRNQLNELSNCAFEMELTPLVECHSRSELDIALEIKNAVIGVNNRDLETLEIDRGIAPMLLRELPPDSIAIAESGYKKAVDTDELHGLTDAVLVGSALMKLEEPGSFIREVQK